jgi:hypothetical protein
MAAGSPYRSGGTGHTKINERSVLALAARVRIQTGSIEGGSLLYFGHFKRGAIQSLLSLLGPLRLSMTELQ